MKLRTFLDRHGNKNFKIETTDYSGQIRTGSEIMALFPQLEEDFIIGQPEPDRIEREGRKYKLQSMVFRPIK